MKVQYNYGVSRLFVAVSE